LKNYVKIVLCTIAAFVGIFATPGHAKPSTIETQNYILSQVNKGEKVNLLDRFEKEEDRVVKAEFLYRLIAGEIESVMITKYGVQIIGAIIINPLDLELIEIPFILYFKNCTFQDRLSFSHSGFTDHCLFSNVTFLGDVAFVNTTFSKRLILESSTFHENADFSAAKFKTLTRFTYTKFLGGSPHKSSDFSLAHFSKLVHFQSVVFNQMAIFDGVNFDGNAIYQSAEFRGGADFSDADFNGRATFHLTKFFQLAYFYKAAFKENLDFQSSEFFKVANFNEIVFSSKSIWDNAQFHDSSSFSGSSFQEFADFSVVKFLAYPDFSNSTFQNSVSFKKAYLEGADFRNSNLANSDFSGAFLSEADFQESNLDGCQFWDVKSFPNKYEPRSGGSPYIPSVADLQNLSKMTFLKSPHGLVDLRLGFKNLSYREQERKVTYAIKRTQRLKLWNSNFTHESEDKRVSIFDKIESVFHLVLFELPCAYGMQPGRPLMILAGFILLFTIPYTEFISRKNEDGIWKIWINDRVRKDLGHEEPERIYLIGFQAMKTGFYLSLLSAFSIGWKDLNVGNWIARIQKREYVLKATGWARVVSGIQSLISVYLLALWALSYFGRPFETI